MQLYIDKRIPQGERIAFCCGFVRAAFTTPSLVDKFISALGGLSPRYYPVQTIFNVALVSLLGALRRA